MNSKIIKLVEELQKEFLEKSGMGSQVSIFLCGGAGKQEGELRKAIGAKELAEVMHVDCGLIRKFCGGQKYFYRRYTIPKSNGKQPHSKRCRARPASLNFAKRLDCGAFTAAFVQSVAVVVIISQRSESDPAAAISFPLLPASGFLWPSKSKPKI